jgi:hypothetical protein
MTRSSPDSEAIEAGAQALANDVWHPPQSLKMLSPSEANKFRRQSRLVLEAQRAPAQAAVLTEQQIIYRERYRCRAKKIGLPPSRRPLPAGELSEDLVELEDGHSALDRLSISRTEEGVPLAICERINLLAAPLQTIARFPISDPKNMDAMNMKMIAEGAIALSRADERPFLDHGYCTCGRHRDNQCDQCLSLSRPVRP